MFTPRHTKFDCTLKIDGKDEGLNFPYQCNMSNSEPDTLSILECLVLDAQAFESSRDLADFLYEFGYNENAEGIRKGTEAYAAYKKTSEFFSEMLSEKQKDDLYEATSEGLVYEDDYEAEP